MIKSLISNLIRIKIIIFFTAISNFSLSHDLDSSWVNIKNHGAVGNNSTANDNAFNAAIQKLVQIGGGTLYIPKGIYRVQSKIKINNANIQVNIVGDGVGISKIVWTGTNGGIEYNANSLAQRELTVQNLTLMTTSTQDGGIALRAEWPGIPGAVEQTAYIKNVEIRGYSHGNTWSKGIHLLEARNAVIDKVDYYGNVNSISTSGAALEIVSQNSSTEYYIKNFKTIHADNGILVSGGTGGGNGPEGIYIDQSTFINVNYGIGFNTTDSEPLLNINGSHFNTYIASIVSKAQQSTITNNLFYQNNRPDNGASAGIILIDTKDVIIRNNIFYGNPTQSDFNAIVLQSGTNHCSIVGNHFTPFAGTKAATTAIWLQGNTANNKIAQNIFSGSGYTTYLNQGATSNINYGW